MTPLLAIRSISDTVSLSAFFAPAESSPSMATRMLLSALRRRERNWRLRSRFLRLCLCAFSADAWEATLLLSLQNLQSYHGGPRAHADPGAGLLEGRLLVREIHDLAAVDDFGGLVDLRAGLFLHAGDLVDSDHVVLGLAVGGDPLAVLADGARAGIVGGKRQFLVVVVAIQKLAQI